MILPPPGPEYDSQNEAQTRRTITEADENTQKKDEDFVVKKNRLVLVSPDGTKYSGTISNVGVLTWTAL